MRLQPDRHHTPRPRFPLIGPGVLLLAVVASACRGPANVSNEVDPTQESAPTAQDACTFAGAWSVKFLVSGGLAGIQQELLVDSDGQASYTDRGGTNPTTWALGGDDLQELGRLLELACPFEPQDSRPSQCMDCFIFRLEVVSGQNRYLWEADESQAMPASIRSLIDQLEAIRSMAM